MLASCKLISAAGTPDNLRVLPDGSGLIASLFTVFDEKNPLITKSLAETPVVRKFIARLLRLIEIPFEFLDAQFPHSAFAQVVYNVSIILLYLVFFSGFLSFVRQLHQLPTQIRQLSGLCSLHHNNEIYLRVPITYEPKLVYRESNPRTACLEIKLMTPGLL